MAKAKAEITVQLTDEARRLIGDFSMLGELAERLDRLERIVLDWSEGGRVRRLDEDLALERMREEIATRDDETPEGVETR